MRRGNAVEAGHAADFEAPVLVAIERLEAIVQ
jgi:hypothetical protein